MDHAQTAGASDTLGRILLVEEPGAVFNLVHVGLEFEGFEVSTASSGHAALQVCRVQPPQLVILDTVLPDLDGFSVCRQLRGMSTVPILVLTERNDVRDIVQGLDSGADDCLPKPFMFNELLARVRAILRRAGHHYTQQLKWGDLVLDRASYEVTYRGRRVELTLREFTVLEILMRRPRQVQSFEQIMLGAWAEPKDIKILKTCISSLRAKLGDNSRRLIRLVRGVGYTLGAPQATAS